MNLEQPLVTIGIVTYNQESLVSRAIESVLNQSYTNYELLINDDCSKDNTWEIISQYDDPRISAVRNEKNVYQYANRNFIINRAKGKYLIFVDGDDLMLSFGLHYLVNMLEANPDCAYIGSHFFKNNVVYPIKLSSREFLICNYFGNDFLGTALAAVVFRTEALKQAGGFSTKYISSDILIRLKLSMQYPTLITDIYSIWWRETPDQESSKINYQLSIKEAYNQMKEILLDNNCPLDDKEIKDAFTNFDILLSRRIIKLIFTFRWKQARSLLNTNSGIKLTNFHKSVIPYTHYIFKDINCLNPLTIENLHNPYIVNGKGQS